MSTDAASEVKKITDELNVKTTELNNKITTLESKNKEQKADITTQADKLQSLTNESFERPHGQITFVNLRNNTVYINLGFLADALQRQVTFSVYDQGINTLEVPDAALLKDKEKTKEKSKRKVRHPSDRRHRRSFGRSSGIFWMIRSRIPFSLATTFSHPLGVQVRSCSSPWWASFIDGDRISDREKVKNLILANGGEITCELPENGKAATGRISVDTRYLVIGERPSEKANDEAAPLSAT